VPRAAHGLHCACTLCTMVLNAQIGGGNRSITAARLQLRSSGVHVSNPFMNPGVVLRVDMVRGRWHMLIAAHSESTLHGTTTTIATSSCMPRARGSHSTLALH
jgi:hypothetical protein